MEGVVVAHTIRADAVGNSLTAGVLALRDGDLPRRVALDEEALAPAAGRVARVLPDPSPAAGLTPVREGPVGTEPEQFHLALPIRFVDVFEEVGSAVSIAVLDERGDVRTGERLIANYLARSPNVLRNIDWFRIGAGRVTSSRILQVHTSGPV
jgi:hypothetical protein